MNNSEADSSKKNEVGQRESEVGSEKRSLPADSICTIKHCSLEKTEHLSAAQTVHIHI